MVPSDEDMGDAGGAPDEEIIDTGFGELAEEDTADPGSVEPEDMVEEQPAPVPICDPNTGALRIAAVAVAAEKMAQKLALRATAAKEAREGDVFVKLGDDGAALIKSADGSVRLKPADEVEPASAGVTETPRMLTRREAEMEAGRRVVAQHEQLIRNRPIPVKTKAEIESEGHSMPVFRPGDFREYRDLKANHTSKDAGGPGPVNPAEAK